MPKLNVTKNLTEKMPKTGFAGIIRLFLGTWDLARAYTTSAGGLSPMSTRALTIAGAVLLGWVLVHSGHRHDWSDPHVVVAGSGIHNVDWNDEHLDAALDDLDSKFDDLDVDVDDGSIHIGWDGAHPMTTAQRERLRAEIRENIARARNQAWRSRDELRNEMGHFRSERSRLRDEIRNTIRGNRDEFRNEWRANRDQIRRQSRELRDQIRESIRESIRHHHDDDIY
jgi:hypothetical protein